jgi:hypothetical protein
MQDGGGKPCRYNPRVMKNIYEKVFKNSDEIVALASGI